MKHLSGLNEEQKAAVLHNEGALLILAGAGAGKTRVIVHRIAELIRQGTPPEKILAVTFTNKAAKEMQERVSKLLQDSLLLSTYTLPQAASGISASGGTEADGKQTPFAPRTRPYIGTFHALSLEILKTFHTAANLPKRVTIYDRGDSTRALKEAIKNAGFDPKELEPRRVLSVMGRHKGNAVDLETFRASYLSTYIDEAIADVWEKYEAMLAKEKALDFDDILIRAYKLLESSREAREYFQNAWNFIHVDEYQDTNRVQYELVRLLSGAHGNIAAVGDADQNIYSWRGASIEHILNFERDFPNASLVVLSENYRSTQTILAAANDAIAKNVRRKEKNLYTKNESGEKITVAGFSDENEEARFVAKEAKHLIAYGVPADSIAVLYRANFQSRVLEEAFLREDVPYQVLGTRFYERREIKDALAYLSLALNPDSARDLIRAIATPARGIGKVTLAKIVQGAEATLPVGAGAKVREFRSLVARIAQSIENKKPSEAVRYAVVESGMWRMYEKGDEEDTERLENLKELVTVATKYDHLADGEGVGKLLEEAALQSDQDELNIPKEGVKLMTVHAAKGLEFERVFVTGLEEGLFPHERDESDNVDDEEERRLFYVALTRAQKKVYLTWAITRQIFGTRSLNTPSEFITELDPEIAEVVGFPESKEYETID
jgi:DNA helicase II / ATP-dependent DNA helicase PcrA